MDSTPQMPALTASRRQGTSALRTSSWQLIQGQTLHFQEGRPLLMGIVNVTPDSFSDGGRFLATKDAIDHGLKLAEEGADILDIGGESTRPGSLSVSVEEECARVLPVIESLAERCDVPISIDTTKAEVAEAAIAVGASIVNDISCMRFDPALPDVVARTQAHLIIMHSRHTPADMQKSPYYEDLWSELCSELRQGVQRALDAGVPPSHIATDPGIGFGKRLVDNLQILRDLTPLHAMGYPILIGASRKSFLGKLLDADVDQRKEGSLAAASAAISAGAQMLRVHDVKETRQLIDVLAAIHASSSPSS